jgi:hypothetical protein
MVGTVLEPWATRLLAGDALAVGRGEGLGLAVGGGVGDGQGVGLAVRVGVGTGSRVGIALSVAGAVEPEGDQGTLGEALAPDGEALGEALGERPGAAQAAASARLSRMAPIRPPDERRRGALSIRAPP